MTLRDKIQEEINSDFGYNNKLFCDKLEKMADDYALDFGEWLRVEAYDAGNNWIYLQDNQDYTTEELRKIFKKEKGL
jgi:hypothetical protein